MREWPSVRKQGRPKQSRRPTRRARSFPEHKIQAEFVARFRLEYPKLKRLLFAVPNGGKRNPREAGRLKAEGVLAGVPDLFLSVPSGEYHGMYLETKAPRGKLSRDQELVIAGLRDQGYYVCVYTTSDGAMREVAWYLAPHAEVRTASSTS